MNKQLGIFLGLIVFSTFTLLPISCWGDDTSLFSHIRESSHESLRMDFIQSSTTSLFDTPLVSEGTITIKRPSTLCWEYTKPYKSGFSLSGGTGSQWSINRGDGTTQTRPLSPVLQIVGEQLLLWLTGDETLLKKDFTINHTEQGYSLAPLDPTMQEYIAEIQIFIDKDATYIETITIQEASGNSTNIDFSHIGPSSDSSCLPGSE